MFDKTGTLTSGVPTVADVEPFGATGSGELLRLAASLDQVSPHVLAGAVVRSAREHEVELEFPDAVVEKHGAASKVMWGSAGSRSGRPRSSPVAPHSREELAMPGVDRCSMDRRACSSPSTARSRAPT